jgi:integrase
VATGRASGAAGTAAGRVICAWRSEVLSEPAQRFARAAAAAAAPATPARAKAFVFAAAKLAGFAEQVGLELEAEVLLDPSVIERFILCGCETVSPASRRTLRTNLRALARALQAHPPPGPVTLARERAKRPYSEAEIDGYLRLAAAQPTRARRARATALVCLGAGAGIIASELRHLRGSDVAERAGGVIVAVAGTRARSVPVLAGYQQPLLEAARFAGQRLIAGGRQPGRRNISDALCRALSIDAGLPRLEPGRLRSTWLVACADQIGLAAFMHAAGVRCSQRLGDLAAQLPEPGETELVALLGSDGGHARDG